MDKLTIFIYFELSRLIDYMVLGGYLNLRASQLPVTTVLILCEDNSKSMLLHVFTLEHGGKIHGGSCMDCPLIKWTVVRVH